MVKNVDYLLNNMVKNGQKGIFPIIDPDRLELHEAIDLALYAEEYGASAILVGSTIMLSNKYELLLKELHPKLKIPLIILPGLFYYVNSNADAIFLLSLISGRNPDLLIGEQVKVAPLLKQSGIEVLSTGYLLVDGGNLTSVNYMSQTIPIPWDKDDIAMVHALAGQYLGMKYIFLEAGSGADRHVSLSMIKSVKEYINIPLIVGGGINNPDKAKAILSAGANFIVVGGCFEKSNNKKLSLKNFIQETLK